MVAWLGDVAAQNFWWCAVIGFLAAIAWETATPERATRFPAIRWINHLLIYAGCIVLAAVFDPAQAITALIPTGAPVPFRIIQATGGATAVLIVGLLLLDLAVYGLHRLQHAVFPLWRFHAVHHSDTEMDASTALRHHPLAYLMVAVSVSVLFPLLGMPLWVFAVYGVVLFAAALFQHLNVRLPDRLEKTLQLVIVCPDMHRLHHSTVPDHYNSNFGNVLSVWDRLFGTYRYGYPARTGPCVRTGSWLGSAARFATALDLAVRPAPASTRITCDPGSDATAGWGAPAMMFRFRHCRSAAEQSLAVPHNAAKWLYPISKREQLRRRETTMTGLKRILGLGFGGMALAAVAAITPASAFVVSADGTCISGTCGSPDVLGAGMLISLAPFSGSFTVNGDPFSIVGVVTAANLNGLTTILNPSFRLTYTGTAPLAQADMFDVNIQQNFASTATLPGVYQYEQTGTGSPGIAPSSSLTVDNLINGVSVSGGGVTVSLPGPFDTGFQFNTISTIANPLTDVFSYAFNFESNTLPGAYVEVAEPGALFVMGIGLIAIGAVRRRVRRLR